jgi:hypothetical protein
LADPELDIPAVQFRLEIGKVSWAIVNEWENEVK